MIRPEDSRKVTVSRSVRPKRRGLPNLPSGKRSDTGLAITALDESSEMKGPFGSSEEASAWTQADLREIPAPKLSLGSRGAKGLALPGKRSNAN